MEEKKLAITNTEIAATTENIGQAAFARVQPVAKAQPVEAKSSFAQGFPGWSLVPPQVMVRRKK